jgi:hypothetical protein
MVVFPVRDIQYALRHGNVQGRVWSGRIQKDVLKEIEILGSELGHSCIKYQSQLYSLHA